eukprot:SAG31_NODE_5860_length_2285_cov_1.997713_4_plen_236_part_01
MPSSLPRALGPLTEQALLPCPVHRSIGRCHAQVAGNFANLFSQLAAIDWSMSAMLPGCPEPLQHCYNQSSERQCNALAQLIAQAGPGEASPACQFIYHEPWEPTANPTVDVVDWGTDECYFVQCDDTVGDANTCIDADLGLDATDCACLAAIPQYSYTPAVTEGCTRDPNLADENTVCDETTLIPATPAGCAIPAPEYERGDGCDADPPTATNCDTVNTPEPSDYWTAQVDGEVRS